MLNPGLAPWAMQEYRPYRALLRPHQLLAYSDALALVSYLMKCLLVLMRLSSRPHQLLAYSDALALATSLIKCWLIGVCWFVDYV